MILINKNANNYITVTLFEKTTLAVPYYLFVFTNDLTKGSVKFTCSDLSTEKQRYNLFLITETSGTNIPTSGVVTLNPTGFYHYKIYEQTDPNNLDETLTTSVVEIGKVLVKGDTTIYSAYDGQDKNYTVYGTGS